MSILSSREVTIRSQQAQVHFVRFRDGKGIEHRAVRDDLGMMQQLGVIPVSAHEHAAES
jgi:hypothetical protein